MEMKGQEREYCFDPRDDAIIASAEAMLKKIAAAPSVKPRELVSVAKLLHVFSRLPSVPQSGVEVSVSIISPGTQYGEFEILHWWEVRVEGEELLIRSGGQRYQTGGAGDTFTTMAWTARPGEPPGYADYRDSFGIVP